MRFGKCSLHLPFTIAVEDHITENEDRNRGGKDECAKAKADTNREPPQRHRPAILHRSTFVAPVAASNPKNVTLALAPASSFPHGRWTLIRFPVRPCG
jgi:hypothetical protein